MRKWNFNPGPAVLPLPVLETLQKNTVEYGSLGMSLLEMSHRSKDFEAILNDCKARFHEVFGIPEGYEVLFLGGGASLQFSMVAMNFMKDGAADYLVTGTWAKKALKEAKLWAAFSGGKPAAAASTESENFTRLPKPEEMKFNPAAKYVHLTSNNTVYGTQWHAFPETPAGVRVVADMSSDILSRAVDVSKFDMIYAGAQKNLGPAGVTVVIVKKDWLAEAAENIPTMMAYKTHAENNSLYNTPPVYAVYVVKLVLDWVKDKGGVEAVEKDNNRKAEILYGVMDANADYYKGTVVDKGSRSTMNVTFRMPTEELEAAFIKEAAASNFHGLKGHRSVGGIRVSMYNALELYGIERLCEFMAEFRKNH
jgi:phosphoserine aminotransferase